MMLLYRGESFDANFFYHSGVDIDHSFLLADGKKRTLLTPRMNEGAAKAGFRGRVVAYTDPVESLSKLVKGNSVLCDGSSMSMRMASRLSKICRLKDDSAALLQARAKKRDDEAADIRKAARLTREIFSALDPSEAKTELDLQKQIMIETAERGLEQAFDPIVATGISTSFPHYRASKRKLGSVVLVDYGVRWNHYCADLTRCFILDGDRKKKAEYERLEGVCHAIIDELPRLRNGKDVAGFSEKELSKAGFPKLIHSIGHGVGLDIHEFPRLGLKSEDPIARSTLAIEPAFYYPKKYGMRYEETVWFDGKKARIL
ncbi:MAG: Xaa-Pro peptidase family protein [Candidatus Micrarchaeia archaeon]